VMTCVGRFTNNGATSRVNGATCPSSPVAASTSTATASGLYNVPGNGPGVGAPGRGWPWRRWGLWGCAGLAHLPRDRAAGLQVGQCADDPGAVALPTRPGARGGGGRSASRRRGM
jgi:hypothetical protein